MRIIYHKQKRRLKMILVTGATGLNGSELVRRLSARGVHVRALVRSAAKAEGLASLPMVEIVEGDMASPETLTGPLARGDRAKVFLASGPASLEGASTVLTSAGHEGKIYPITGPEALSMAEVAEKFSVATGKRIRYVNVAPEEAKKAQLAAGVPPYTADALAELFAERRKGKEAQVSPVIQTIFGWRATSFDEFAMRNAAIFRGEQPAPKV